MPKGRDLTDKFREIAEALKKRKPLPSPYNLPEVHKLIKVVTR